MPGGLTVGYQLSFLLFLFYIYLWSSDRLYVPVADLLFAKAILVWKVRPQGLFSILIFLCFDFWVEPQIKFCYSHLSRIFICYPFNFWLNTIWVVSTEHSSMRVSLYRSILPYRFKVKLLFRRMIEFYGSLKSFWRGFSRVGVWQQSNKKSIFNWLKLPPV